MLGEKLLQFADNLSCTLQHSDMSVTEGHSAALSTCCTLSNVNTNEEFTRILNVVVKKAYEFNINEPVLTRKRNTPTSFVNSDTNVEEPHCPTTVKVTNRNILKLFTSLLHV